jgi:hypothetical protein
MKYDEEDYKTGNNESNEYDPKSYYIEQPYDTTKAVIPPKSKKIKYRPVATAIPYKNED